MKALIIYDSLYSNTEKIARAIAGSIHGSVRTVHVTEASPEDLNDLDLLIVGSPTQGGRPTPAIATFLKHIPVDALDHITVAAFDTRFGRQEHGLGLKVLMSVIGFAAPRIAVALEHKGGHLAAPPEGFIVMDKEGPLEQGELDRAATWAAHFAS